MNMWLLFAVGSSFFAGITAILVKIGVQNTDSHLLTALRTVVVMVFSWMMVFLVGSQGSIQDVSAKTLVFLCVSGVTTGASWICYFHALQIGDINKVVPIDKSSVVLTILLGVLFLGEPMNMLKAVCVILIAAGTYLMIEKKDTSKESSKNARSALIYAALSAIFASLTAILSKIGIVGIESNLGTAIRTIVVLIMAWMIVLAGGKQKRSKRSQRRAGSLSYCRGLQPECPGCVITVRFRTVRSALCFRLTS